ncbi:hypothetical protein ACIREO_28185 [Streptomyces sp. NPDC102441]|uniref:hypothetical protein n=1 Tax=Streptomyces sp. NPDC102441 TaxID=3366176 RepID=UPI0038038E77
MEANAWLGSTVTVLPDVTVGLGAVVGAGAVVTQDVPSDTLVTGPAANAIDGTTEPGDRRPDPCAAGRPGGPAASGECAAGPLCRLPGGRRSMQGVGRGTAGAKKSAAVWNA